MSLFSRNDIDNMLKNSRIGLWKLEREEGKPLRLYADEVMDALIGIDSNVSPEERAAIHLSRIHVDDKGLFDDYAKALAHGYAEIVYRYEHPLLGTAFVRCSGRTDFEENRFVCIKGMHQDITKTIHIENEKVIEQRILEAQSVAEEANQARDQYIEKYLKERRDKDFYLYQSQHDMATQTLRKEFFLGQAKAYLEEQPERLAVVFIDIDEFKEVNDRLGHVLGDKAIEEIAAIIRHSFADKDLICRYGGDEFCVLMKDVLKTTVVEKLQSLNKKFQLDYSNGVNSRHITCSIGAVCYDASFGPIDVFWLIERADFCLYKAKASGRDQFYIEDCVRD